MKAWAYGGSLIIVACYCLRPFLLWRIAWWNQSRLSYPSDYQDTNLYFTGLFLLKPETRMNEKGTCPNQRTGRITPLCHFLLHQDQFWRLSQSGFSLMTWLSLFKYSLDESTARGSMFAAARLSRFCGGALKYSIASEYNRGGRGQTCRRRGCHHAWYHGK